jgi:hypothetical protein
MVLDDSPCAVTQVWNEMGSTSNPFWKPGTFSVLNNSNNLNAIGRLLQLTNLKSNESLLY